MLHFTVADMVFKVHCHFKDAYPSSKRSHVPFYYLYIYLIDVILFCTLPTLLLNMYVGVTMDLTYAPIVFYID